VIAYAFPPCGGGGVQRTAKFVRYLPEFGWLPTVLTVSDSYYGANLDLSHISEFPDVVEIIRTPRTNPLTYFSPVQSVANGIKSRLNHLPGMTRWMRRMRMLAKRRRAPSTRFHPGGAMLWCLRTLTAGLKAHRRRRFELIYATGEPYSDFLIAWILSRLIRVPFVLDMRDPWTIDPYVEEPNAPHQMVQRWEERRILLACSACVFANHSILSYKKTFPEWKDKFHYIPNGFDSADLDAVMAKRFDRFTIVHNGNLLPGYRTADVFLLALRDLLNARSDLRQRIQVLFVGRIGPEETLLHDLSLDGVVKQLGYVPHRRSIEYLKGADLLLLIGGRHLWEETGKIYEYIASGRPILALLRPDGAAADLLRRHLTARIVDRENVAEARAALTEAVRSGLAAQIPDGGPIAAIRQWERRHLTGQLARILDGCVPASLGTGV
jgi:glycosyltransferase involved in cell wall biosynthesis